MTTRRLFVDGYDIALIVPEGACRFLVYAHAAVEGEAERVHTLIAREDTALAYINTRDWNAELSPWPARRAFKGGEDFAGGAERHLTTLENVIVPAVEEALGARSPIRALAGYSLAGLFALYALYRTDLFPLIGSMSGSLWYDGFLDDMRAREPMARGARVYLSVGDTESKTRNARVNRVEECTRAAKTILSAQGAAAAFELNAGNHFVDAPERVAKGIRWLLEGET